MAAEHTTTSNDVGYVGKLYKACLSLFIILHKYANNSTIVSDVQRNCLRKQLEQFLLWGDGCGASDGGLDMLQHGSTSSPLDTLVLRLLSAVGRTLLYKMLPLFTRSGSDLLGDKAHAMTYTVAMSVVEESKNIDVEEVYDSEDNESTSEITSTKLARRMKEIIGNLTVYVDCLSDLTPALECTAAKSMGPGIDTSISDVVLEAKLNVSEVARPYCMKISDRFPRADVKLVERLGEANAERHKRIRDKSLRFDGRQEAYVKASEKSSSYRDSALGDSLLTSSALSVKFQLPNTDTSKSQQKTGVAESALSLTSLLSNDESAELRVPALPAAVSEGKSFVCCICERVISHIGNRIEWRKHVFSDLQPYVCTHTDCSDRSTFSTRNDWWKHEYEFHWSDKHYRCQKCGQVFRVENDFIAHCKELHLLRRENIDTNVEIVNISSLHKLKDQACPLCFDKPGSSASKIARHVSKHLEQIALAVIPRDVDEDEITIDTGSSEDGKTSTQPAALSGKNTSPPMPATIDAVIDDTNTKDREFDEVGSNVVQTQMQARSLKIVPTLEGFRQHAQAFGPSLPAFMLDRIAVEQYRRFTRIRDNKIDNNSSTSIPEASEKLSTGTRGELDGHPYSHPLLEDLVAFTCTFPLCDEEAKSFGTKADWIRHENEQHRQLEWWTCRQGNCSQKFYQIDKFVQHLRRDHKLSVPNKNAGKAASSRDGANFWQMVQDCGHRTPRESKNEPCIFCGRKFMTWDELMHHVAIHMERFALPVLQILEPKDNEPSPAGAVQLPTELQLKHDPTGSTSDQSLSETHLEERAKSNSKTPSLGSSTPRLGMTPKAPSSSGVRPSFIFQIKEVRSDANDRKGDFGWRPPIRATRFRAGNPAFYRWSGGNVSTISTGVLNLDAFHTATVVCIDSSSHLLGVNLDVSKPNLSADESWRPFSFRHELMSPRERYTFIDLAGEHSSVAAPQQRHIVPQLLPELYQSKDTTLGNGGLVGKLTLLLALAAFSAPPSHQRTVMVDHIRPLHWRPHNYTNGRYPRRGLVVSIFFDPVNPAGSTPTILRRLENGDFGPFFGPYPA